MYSKFDTDELGKKIVFHRKRLGFTQSMLANKLHVSYQAISAWENSSTLPDIANLCRLSEVFGISLDELLKSGNDSPAVLLGIDGGGTKTEFVVFDQSGNVLKRFCLSGSNSSHIGIGKTLEILYTGIDSCIDEFSEIQAIYAGIAGVNIDTIKKKLGERYYGIKSFVQSDAVNALNSAEGDFALICGTGSILVTRDKNGRYRYIGGWGSKFGDPCSAYNFGKAALKCGLAYEDGILNDSTIYTMLIQKTGFNNLHESAITLDEPSVAALAPIVFEAYGNGCKAAENIIMCEVKEIADLINTAFPNGGRLIACGSVIKYNKSCIIPVLDKYTNGKFTFVLPPLPPVYGACVACCDELKIIRDIDFENSFLKSYDRL